MAGSSVQRAVPAADRQQRAEPLLGKGGCAKRGLWHRRQPAARYAQVPWEARSPRGGTARWDASMQTSCSSPSPGTRGRKGVHHPPASTGLGQAGVAGCKC